jgi:hypothetical protein
MLLLLLLLLDGVVLQSQAPAALNASYLAKELPAMRTTKTSSACLIKHSGKAGARGVQQTAASTAIVTFVSATL